MIPIELTNLKDLVEDYFNCCISDKTRQRHVVYSRKVYSQLATEIYTEFTYNAIGSVINRDHSTVIAHKNSFYTIYDYHLEGYRIIKDKLLGKQRNKRKDALELALYYRKKYKLIKN